MSTKKISDLMFVEVCRNREHSPPSMMVYQPGVYEHTCPGCGHVTKFRVDRKYTL